MKGLLQGQAHDWASAASAARDFRGPACRAFITDALRPFFRRSNSKRSCHVVVSTNLRAASNRDGAWTDVKNQSDGMRQRGAATDTPAVPFRIPRLEGVGIIAPANPTRAPNDSGNDPGA